MNLKLFKPDYIADKKKRNLDYTFFGEYVKKAGNKFIFKGGFGGNTNIKVNQKRHHCLIDILEHNFQIHSIIKRFKETLGSKYSNSKEEKNFNQTSLTSRKLAIQLSNNSSRIINQQNLCLSQSFIPNNTFIYQLNKSVLIPRLMSFDSLLNNKDEPSLSLIEQLPYINNKNCISNYNRKKNINDNILQEQTYQKNSTGLLVNCKYNEIDDYFIKSDEEYYHDRNYLFNKYKRKFDFFQSQKIEDKFEAKRSILFKKNNESTSYSLPKPSKYKIHLMLLKNKKIG